MKQRFTLSITFLFAMLFSVATSFAQSGNNCANAIPVTVNVNSCEYTLFTNAGLTNSGQTPLVCAGFSGGDLWLTAVFPPSGEMTFVSSLDPDNPIITLDFGLAVYEGSCGSLTQIDCDNDSGGADMPAITLTGTPGNTVYIQMWNVGNAVISTFRVCINGTPTCTAPFVNYSRSCAGDNGYQVELNIFAMNTASSIDLAVNGDVVTTGITGTGIYVVGPYPIDFDIELAVIPTNDITCTDTRTFTAVNLGCEYVLTCGTDLDQDYCYKNSESDNNGAKFLYTSPSGSPVTVTFNSGLIQDDVDHIRIYDGVDDSGAQLNIGETSGINPVGLVGDLAGLTYIANSGSIFMKVQSDVGGSCRDGSLGLGGGWDWTVICGTTMCDGATNIVSQTTFAASEVSGDLNGQTFSGLPQCGETNNENPDEFFTFTAVGTVQYIRVNASGDFDPVVQVYDECDGTSIACINEAGPGLRELFWLTDLTIGQEYAYRVFHDGVGNSSTTAYETAVAHIPIVQLRAQDCGSTGLLANSIIRSTTPNPNYLLDGFIWEFTELEAPFTVYEVNSPNGSNPQFRIYWFTDYEYGRSYDVRIKARMYQGPNVGEYGPSCTIALAEGVTTALQPIYADEDYQFCDVIKAIPVTGGTNYRWEFNDGSETLTYNSNSSNYFCSLQNVNGLQMSAAYDVDIFVTVNGIESTVSTTRTINTVLPTTALNPAFFACGSNVNITQGTQALNVCGAENYTFEFTNMSQVLPVIEYLRPNRAIVFSWVPGLVPGDTYNVRVKAFVGGTSTEYGTPCEVTFNGLTGIAELPEGLQFADENEGIMPALTIYPNPVTNNDSQIMISAVDLTSGQQDIEVRVFDMSGRMMTSERYGNNGSSFNAILNLDEAFATGVYIVTTTVNGAPLKTEKLIVE